MEIEFGIFDHIDQRDEPLTQTFAERIEFIRAAEQGDIRGYHLAEHHGTPLGMAPSPNIFLSAVAQATTRIRLGAMVYLLPLYIPLRLIEEICMLDHLSNGRLDIGTGRGVSPIETGFYGLDAKNSGPLYGEALDVLVKGLSCDRLDHHGKYFDYDDVPMPMQPLQKPLPLWSAGVSPEGQVYAAQRGMNLVALGATSFIKKVADNYKQTLPQYSDHPLRALTGTTTPYIGAYRIVFVGEDDESAGRLARNAYNNGYKKLVKLWNEYNVEATFFVEIESFDAARDIGMVVVGSANRVADQLAEQIETTGINYMMVQLAFGDLPHSEEMASLERFITKVM